MTNAKTFAARLLVLGSVLVPCAVHADDYRGEARLDFTRNDFPDSSFLSHTEILGLSGTWYFAPVNTDGVPLSEAAYLGRASYVSGIASQIDILGEHLDAQALTGGYYVPHSMFFIGATVARSAGLLVNSTTTRKTHDTSWSAKLGLAPVDGLLITTRFDNDDYTPNLGARYVSKLPNSHFYAASVNAVDPDGGDIDFGVDFDYFFDLTLSAGIGYQDGGSRWTARAEKFFTPRFSVGGSVYDEDFGHGFSVSAALRF
jgi:hypothetical protein